MAPHCAASAFQQQTDGKSPSEAQQEGQKKDKKLKYPEPQPPSVRKLTDPGNLPEKLKH
jgi:hypothetical protein